MRSCNRSKKMIYAKERKGIFVVEREEICEFIKEQLRKGYIRPSNLSQIAPVFCEEKKDSKKRMVQDYRYLNEWTIKNNYPLLLISDIVENIDTKKVFTKLDL